MSNKQFAVMETQAKALDENLRRCPTCGSSIVAEAAKNELNEVTSVDLEYREYKLYGVTHRCDCRKQDELRCHYLLAHIPRKYWRYSADDWYGDPEAFACAAEYVEHWPDYKTQGIGIEFYSPGQGSGKTFLATWIARQLVQRGESVYYTRFLSLMDLYQRIDRYEIEDRLRYSTALVLDEVGTAMSDAQWALYASKFEDLMRDRIDNALPTIMTTNMTPEDLDQEYPRIYSLLAGSQQRYEVSHEDVRRKGETLMLDKELIRRGEKRPVC